MIKTIKINDKINGDRWMKMTPFEKEGWSQCTKYLPIHIEVSNYGRVCVYVNGEYHIVKERASIQGYCYVEIGEKQIMVHNLVASEFVFRPHNTNKVIHINGDKLDNRAYNLRWE